MLKSKKYVELKPKNEFVVEVSTKIRWYDVIWGAFTTNSSEFQWNLHKFQVTMNLLLPAVEVLPTQDKIACFNLFWISTYHNIKCIKWTDTMTIIHILIYMAFDCSKTYEQDYILSEEKKQQEIKTVWLIVA